MKKFLIASHGRLATGVKSTAAVLLHDDSAITAVDCYLDDSDPAVAIKAWIDSIAPEDEAVIFTDLLGGSVCNTVTAMKPEEKGIIHVTGFNVATVLELLLSDDPITPELVDATVAAGSQLMRRVVFEEPADTADDDFFA